MKAHFSSVSSPVLPAERYHLRPQVDRTAAEAKVRAAIERGAFRPPDSGDAATIDDLSPLFVPFWRMDLERTDTTIGFFQVTVGKTGIPIPRRSTDRARTTWMVCARTSFPYKMKNPKNLIKLGVRPLEVTLASILPGDPPTEVSPGNDVWSVLDADVSHDSARTMGGRQLQPFRREHDIATKTDVTVYAAHFVHYPIWFARYRYRGVVTTSGQTFHVGISAIDGEVVTADHPSAFRAGAAKVLGLFRSITRRKDPPKPGPPEAPPPSPSVPRDLKSEFAAHVRTRDPRSAR